MELLSRSNVSRLEQRDVADLQASCARSTITKYSSIRMLCVVFNFTIKVKNNLLWIFRHTQTENVGITGTGSTLAHSHLNWSLFVLVCYFMFSVLLNPIF